MYKKYFVTIMCAIIFFGCSTSESAVQTAISQTEAAKGSSDQNVQIEDAGPSEDDKNSTIESKSATLTAEFLLTPSITPSNTPLPTSTNTPEPSNTPNPSNTPMPTETPLPYGEIVSHADWDYFVSEAMVMTTIGNEVARGNYVVALVEVVNNSTSERDIGSQFFIAEDSQGRIYEMNSDASLAYHQTYKTNAWFLDDIGPSSTATIPIVFDVSPDASGIVLLASGIKKPKLSLIDNVGGELLSLPGESVKSSNWSFVVSSDVSVITSIDDQIARGNFIVVIVTVRNDDLTTREVGSSLFTVKDGEGRTYNMDTDASLEYHQAFKSDAWFLEEIGPSLIGTVPLVFDVSPDATKLKLLTEQGNLEPTDLLENVGGVALELEGNTFSNGDWEFSVQEWSSATSIGDAFAEGEFLIVLLQVKNISVFERTLGSSIFTIKDAQGRIYEMNTDASLEYHQTFKTDAWYLEEIGPSLIGTIPIVFDIATDSTDLVLLTQDGKEIPLTE